MSLSEQWTLATGEEDGKKLIYRIRLAAPTFATKSSLPQLLVALWDFESVNEEQLPAPKEMERMTRLEDLLRAAIEEACQGFLAVIVTGKGLREWQWYVRDAKKTMEVLNKTLGSLEPFPVEFRFQEDPEWAIYGQFLDITSSDQGSVRPSWM